VGQLRDLRLEVDVLVGDVKGENAARREMALVQIDGLRGEKMQRYGIA